MFKKIKFSVNKSFQDEKISKYKTVFRKMSVWFPIKFENYIRPIILNLISFSLLGLVGYYIYKQQDNNKNSELYKLKDQLKELKEKFLGKENDEEDKGILGKLDDSFSENGILGNGKGSITGKVGGY